MAGVTRDILLASRADERAYARIVREYGGVVRATCAARCQDHRDVDELVQDVFVTAFGALAALRDPERFAGWLTRIAVNRCLDHARASGGKPRSVELSDASPSRAPTPDASSQEDAVRELARAALSGLPAPEREVVRARIQGDSHDEIAASLGIARQTSMNRLSRARQRLGRLRHRLLESAVLAVLLDRARSAASAVATII